MINKSAAACFKANDIRGRVPNELNEEAAFRIGCAYAEYLRPQSVVIGRDIRSSSKSLSSACAKGLISQGVNVFDLGLCGTEEVYFAVFNGGFSGGIMITASHNPIDYNGLKLVREGSRPIGGDTGLNEIKKLVISEQEFCPKSSLGTLTPFLSKQNYISHILSYVDIGSLKPLKIVADAGNGCAGPIISLLEGHLPCEFIKINHEPNGAFPNGIPNPLLPDKRQITSQAVIKSGADFGIAWDGDFDRCFFYDETGRFIEGYYIVGLLAQAFAKSCPGAVIIHDPRLIYNTVDLVKKAGGTPVMSKTGHAFIKAKMREENAVYGGEMSAHHYFKRFSYCDSGMITWLLIYEILSRANKPLSALVNERIEMFPVSSEINSTVKKPSELFKRVKQIYSKNAIKINEIDGLSFEFNNWRFNLRLSNTEPVVRLNVEAKNDQALMRAKTAELLRIIRN